MPYESNPTSIVELVASWPFGVDDKTYGGQHIRNIKSVLKDVFLGFNAPLIATEDEINYMTGARRNIQEQLDEGSVPDGTSMVFVQSMPPVGWTIDACANNRLLRTADIGQQYGGSWTISGLVELSHYHEINIITGAGDNVVSSAGSSSKLYSESTHTHTLAGNTSEYTPPSVSSDCSWHMQYVDSLVCRKALSPAACPSDMPDLCAGGGLVPPAPAAACVQYTGDGVAGHSITGVGFQPDLIIGGKDVGNTSSLFWTDSVRGTLAHFKSDETTNETSGTGVIQSLDADGFTLGYVAGSATNEDGHTYIAQCFKKTPGFFDIQIFDKPDASPYVYTGSHSLGVKPELMIHKNLNHATGGQHMYFYHKNAGAGYTALCPGIATWSISSQTWDDTEPTATEFTVGRNGIQTLDPYVIYLFASKAGICKIGSYVGTGSSPGPRIDTDFTPSWIWVRCFDTGSSFNTLNTCRNPSNPAVLSIRWDASDPETDWSDGALGYSPLNFLEDGIQILGDGSELDQFNEAGFTYFYMVLA